MDELSVRNIQAHREDTLIGLQAPEKILVC